MDGVLSNQTADVADSVRNIGNLLIGDGNTGNFNGLLDDVRIYDQALTAGEVQALSGGSGALVVAGFSGDPISGTVPLTVTFTNTSTGDFNNCD